MEIKELLKRLKSAPGADLHIVAGLPPALRMNNEVMPMREYGRPTPDQMRAWLLEILDRDALERFEKDDRLRYDLDVARGVADLGRFRVNVYKQRGTVALTIRALPDSIPPLESLGLPAGALDFARALRGLVLITGPRGSGRSTTLAALVNRINHERAVRIMTIEEPVCYVIPSDRAYVTQREVGEGGDTLSFANALRYASRQGIDVLMIGNLAGNDIMRQALELAESGMLVFGTMFTLSAAQTVSRFVECFPADQQGQVVSQLSANLLGVVSQVLLPRADRKGRVLACELMKNNALIRSEIRQLRFDITPMIQQGVSEGMQTLDQALTELVRQNLVDYSTAHPYIRDDATHRMIYQLTGGGHLGTPMPPPSRQNITPPPGTVPRALTDSQIRRRLGTAVIPPWEQQP